MSIENIIIANETYQYKKFSTYPRIPVELQKKLSLSDEQCDYLRIFDASGSFALLHYITSNYNNVPKAVMDWRGVIVNTVTGKVVAKSFPFTRERVIGTMEDIDFIEKEDSLTFPITVSSAYEGTVIRVFNGNFSTHHFIDGRESKWQPSIVPDEQDEKGFSFTTPRTFYEIFCSLVGEDFVSSLNPRFCFVFLLSCDENRLVNKTPNKLVHLATFNENMNEISFKLENENIIYPQTFTLTKEELFSRLSSYSTSDESVGFIFKGEKAMVKIVSQKYHSYRNARGNEPNILIQYLSLKQESERVLLESVYPEHSPAFEYIKNMRNQLLTFLINAYNTRYVERKYLYLTPPLHYFVSRALESFPSAPENDIAPYITRRLEETSGKNIYTMIENFICMTPIKRAQPPTQSDSEEKNIASSLFK